MSCQSSSRMSDPRHDDGHLTSKGLAGNRSIVCIIKDAWKGQVKPTQAEELAELVAKNDIKASGQICSN